jgi:hypothetical protein
MSKLFLFAFVLASCLLHSCATIVNSRTQKIHVTSEQAGVSIVVDSVTYPLPATIRVKRSKYDVPVQAKLDTSKQSFVLKSSFSDAFVYGNLCLSYFAPIGYLIDLSNVKKFGFDKNIHLDYNKKTFRKKETTPTLLALIRDSSAQKSKYGYAVKTSVLSLINPFFNSVSVGLEKHYGTRYSTQVNYRRFTGLREASFVKGLRGWGLSLEQKYFFKQSGNLRVYVSAELGHDLMNYRTTDFFNPRYRFDSLYNDAYTYADTYRISRSISYLQAKLGFQQSFQHFFIELYGGLGLAYRKVHHSYRNNVNDIPLTKIDFDIAASLNAPGEFTTLTVPLNFCIGYRFR